MKMLRVSAIAFAVTLASGAEAQTSYSTGFEQSDGFATGSIEAGATEGNANWQHAANGSTFGSVVSGTAFTGDQSLALVRDQTVNSGVIHGVRSPELLRPTGDGAGETQSGASYNQFKSSFWIRTGASEPGPDPYFVSINAWSNNRMTWVAFDDGYSQANTLQIYASGMNAAGDFDADQLIATNLLRGQWYRIDQSITFVDSPLGGDDLVAFSVYDASNVQIGSTLTTSWDSGYLQAGFGPLLPVNQLNFRTSVGTAGTVAYIDDVRYSVGNAGAVPEPATWAMLITGFGLAGAVARRRKRAFA
jgi:hypothetical protein